MKAKYFAYGSNMNSRQMRSRCPSARAWSTAALRDYRLTFIQPHDDWGGGVAGLVPDPNQIVEGVVYELSEEDLKRLDRFEPVEDGKYWRELVDVYLPNDRAVEVWTYFGSVFSGAPFAPSARYLGMLLKGATEHGLSQDYVSKLKCWPQTP